MTKEKIKYIRLGDVVPFFNMKKGVVATGKYMMHWHSEHATFLQFVVEREDSFEMVSVVEEYLTTPGPEYNRIRDDGYARVQAEIDKYNERTGRKLFVGENSGSGK